MNLFRRAAAAGLALCTVLSCTACGEKTANAMQVGGSDVRAGIYLYYATSAYGEAIDVLRKGGQNFDDVKESKDYKKILAQSDIDGMKADEWIQNKAAEHCETFMAIEKEFEALGLKLTGEELAAAESSAKSSMSFYGEFFEKTGIGEESVHRFDGVAGFHGFVGHKFQNACHGVAFLGEDDHFQTVPGVAHPGDAADFHGAELPFV